MNVYCTGRGGFARLRAHEFECRRLRSVATLREKWCVLRLDYCVKNSATCDLIAETGVDGLTGGPHQLID
jgi:hypothetical protein